MKVDISFGTMGVQGRPGPQKQMLRTAVWCLFLTFCLTRTASAATVTILPPETPGGNVRADLRRIDATDERRDLTLPIGLSTDIGISDGVWELTIISDGYWGSPLIITPMSDAQLQLWPRTTITGTLGRPVPRSDELRMTFESADASRVGQAPQGSTVCQSSEKTWTCPVPAALLDLQFGLQGFATEFRWHVNAAAGTVTDAGRLDFTPGASLAGELEIRGSEKALEKIELSLSAANPIPGQKVRRLTAKSNARGFFQFKGVPAGRYELRAAGTGLITPPRAVDVIAGLNAVLREPLVAAKPRRLSVDILPTIDVEGQRWLVELFVQSPGSADVGLVTQGFASAAGQWSASNVTPGDFTLYVRRMNGSLWKMEEFTMPADDFTLQILVAGQRVKGTVMLGGRPIAATVEFDGSEKFVADEHGQFQGSAPKLPSEKTHVLVTHDSPAIFRYVEVEGHPSPDGETVFDIKLPNTTILGRTINPDGSLVPFATLTIRSEGAKLPEQPFSGEDGQFQVAGLEPGTHKIQADAFRKRSDVVDVEASDSLNPTMIDLVLHEDAEVRGDVMMGTLRVPSAEIYALPRHVATSFVTKGKSDPTGRFVLYLPPGTETYDLIVLSPGFATVTGRIARRDPKKILHVETTQRGGSLTVTTPDAKLVTIRREGGEFRLSWLAWMVKGTVERKEDLDHVTLPNLEPGRYEVCLKARCTPVFVPPLSNATVSLRE
jgi:hypothetical protein